MKISIITICFNNEKDIDKTIVSVINQTYQDIEYIIVDGNSTDKTLEIIYKFEKGISRIISKPNKGLYDTINKKIKITTRDVINLIHTSDSLYNDNVISKIALHFQNININISYN